MKVTKDKTEWFDYNVDIRTRTIFLGNSYCSIDSEINDTSCSMAIKALSILDNSDGEINIIGFSGGGDWDSGMALYDFIKTRRNKVTMTCYGICMSMMTIILQACDYRILSPNCRFMIHDGYEYYGDNHPRTIIKKAEETKFALNTMYDIFLDKIRKVNENYSREKLINLCKFDTYMSAEEAISLGLADKIIKFTS